MYRPRATSAADGGVTCAATGARHATSRHMASAAPSAAARIIPLTSHRAAWFPGGTRLAAQDGFHDERVLAGVVVVAAATPHHPEAERLVERHRVTVARPDLEDDQLEASGASVVEHGPEEGAGDPLPARVGTDCHVGDVDLVRHLPQAQVAGHPHALVARDQAARHAVLLHLVEERAARPGHGERRALDGTDLVEVLGPHAVKRQRRHDASAPPRRDADRVAPASRPAPSRHDAAARAPARRRTPATAAAAVAAPSARAASARPPRRPPRGASARRRQRPGPPARAPDTPTRGAWRHRPSGRAMRTPRPCARPAPGRPAAPPTAARPPSRRASAPRRSAGRAPARVPSRCSPRYAIR